MAQNQLGDGSTDGVLVGASASSNVAFFGAAGTTQLATTTAPVSTSATDTSPYGYATAAQANAIVTWIIAVDAFLKSLGLVA